MKKFNKKIIFKGWKKIHKRNMLSAVGDKSGKSTIFSFIFKTLITIIFFKGVLIVNNLKMGNYTLIVAYRGYSSTSFEYLGYTKGNTVKKLRKLVKKFARVNDYLVVGDLAACNV